MEVILANPRGFCAGVDRAIDIVERALQIYGAPVYVRHEVVHNRYVVDGLSQRGAVFVEELDEVPDGSTVIYSAHGVPKAVQDAGEQRDLRIFDATCPLVTKVHLEVARYAREGMDVVLIGHAGHPEVIGTMGRYSSDRGRIHLVESVDDVDDLEIDDPERLAFVSQTTLSMDDTASIANALRQRFPGIRSPRQDDICYATQNRQDAIKQLCAEAQLVLVVGSSNSSNSNRLREIAERAGRPAYLINGADDIRSEWLDGISRVGVSAGASAPEVLVQSVVSHLLTRQPGHCRELGGVSETIVFPLPKALRQKALDRS